VSLLLDALKRAEQEKLARQGGKPEGDRGNDAPAPAAAPVPPSAPAGRAASLELQPMPSAPSGASAAMAANSPRAEANAAQNMFAAKAAPNDGSRKGLLLWAGLAVLVVIVAAAGGYVWFATQSFTPRSAASTRTRATQLTPITPVPTASPSAAPAQSGAFVPTQQPTAAIQPAAPATSAAPAVEAPSLPASAAPAPRVEDEVAALLRDSSRGRAQAPVRLSPSREVTRVPAEVSRGYRELAAGNVAAARPAYRAALDADPANLDALLGLATVEAIGGNRYAAAALYQRALAVDPRNATAQAGLAALAQGSERPEGLESRLAAGIAQDPQSPQLRFALGNLFASQSRWNEAQLQYFEAYRLDPASADLAFNLAVSLDHLNQPRLAAEYYARAIEAARTQAAQFDPAAAARRLAQLRG
jgi:tetratricopeptide (TPR) repeat protein